MTSLTRNRILTTNTRRPSALERRWARLAGTVLGFALALAALGSPPVVRGQATAELPFGIGERLNYAVTVGSRRVGHGSMSIQGPEDVRGTSTYVLKSEVRARIGIVKAVDRAESWLDPIRMSALRFRKRERRAFAGGEEQVEMYPDTQRWQATGGDKGESPTDAPLDELSFIYFVRTLPLMPDSVYRVVRHYDRDRNPVEVRVVGRDTLRTGAGMFSTIIVEMHVRDARRFHGDGVIRLHLTDDPCRIPVRIETSMPVVGVTVMTLESYTRSLTHLAHGAP
jgi:hypothetical protein